MHWKKVVLLLFIAAACGASRAQLSVPQAQSQSPSFADPKFSPGTKLLFDLEAKFADDVARRGGVAFADWFAPDGVTAESGRKTLEGREAIAAANHWTPAENRLTWTAEGARMSPGGDMGFTWGSYTFQYKDEKGAFQPLTGRYLSVWKQMPDKSWKVVLDTTNDAPVAESGSCCRVQ